MFTQSKIKGNVSQKRDWNKIAALFLYNCSKNHRNGVFSDDMILIIFIEKLFDHCPQSESNLIHIRINAFAWIILIYQICWLENVFQTITKLYDGIFVKCRDKKIDKQLDLQLIRILNVHFALYRLIYSQQGKYVHK